jgi:uncharacterized membrane protein
LSTTSVEPTRPRPRIESLSDMVFGLALSVGAITLVGNPPQSNGQLYIDLASFGFSFLILIQVWIAYTRTMSALPLEDGRTVFFNIVLLFCVSVEPFLFHILNSNISKMVSVAFAVDLGTLTLILGFFKSLLADESRKLIPEDQIEQFKVESWIQFSAAAVYFVSVLPPFWIIMGLGGIPLRFTLWFVALAIMSARGRIVKSVGQRERQRSQTVRGTTSPSLTGPPPTSS